MAYHISHLLRDDPLTTSWAAPIYQLPAPVAQKVSQELAAEITPSHVNIASDLVPSNARVQGDAFGGYLHPR